MLISSKPRGVALGTVLICLVALSLVLFTAVSAGISQLRLAEASTRQEHARNLAEAALSRAIAELARTDFAFGRNTDDRIDVTVDGLPDAIGTVTFNKGEAGFSQGYSLRNLDSDSETPGAKNHPVPGRTVHLVARGKVGSSEQWMECLYYRPPFPDGLAATGPVDAKGLFLTGVQEDIAYQGGDPNSIPPEKFRPANLFSNASAGFNSGEPAVKIGPACDIRGSVGAVGSVSVDPDAAVRDEVLPGSEARAVPDMDLPLLAGEIRQNAVNVPGGGAVILDENWYAKSDGPLNISSLDLNGTALTVNGDLTVNGPITGSGIIIVNGDVNITDGRSEVTTTEQVAIGCSGDFNLSANSPEGNYFQGIVYCEGDLDAHDITVFGAMIVNGKSPARGSAKLDNVRFVQSPGSVQVAGSRWEGFDMDEPPHDITEKPDHFFAIEADVRPTGDGKAYICRVRLCLSDVADTDNKGGADPDKLETQDTYKDKPREWIEQYTVGPDLKKGLFDHKPEVFVSPEFTITKEELDLENGAGLPEDLRIFTPSGSNTISRFVTLAAQGSEEPDAYDLGEIGNALTKKINRAIEGQDDYSITFNPNRLLAELLGSSRILVWRPFR